MLPVEDEKPTYIESNIHGERSCIKDKSGGFGFFYIDGMQCNIHLFSNTIILYPNKAQSSQTSLHNQAQLRKSLFYFYFKVSKSPLN